MLLFLYDLLCFNFEIIKKLLLIFGLLGLVIAIQFVIAKRQLGYGFFIDDWDNLSAYKLFVTNPISDALYAWNTLGPHRFAHVYYLGLLFDIFKYHYEYYNIFNQLLKAFSAFALFPVIYLMFKNKLLAFLVTIIYVTHFSPFGTLDDVSRGEDFLAIISMNIFLTIYIWTSQKNRFNIRILLTLLTLLLTTIFLAPSRIYPLVLLLPFLEIFNFLLNHSSTTLKSSILRLAFFYSPFIATYIYSPGSVSQIHYYRGLLEFLKLGNFQLFLIPFASFGSTFIPPDLMRSLFGNPNYQQLKSFIPLLSSMVGIFGLLYILIGSLLLSKPKRFVIRTLLTGICFSILAFKAASQWLYLDNKFRASVDPGTFIIPALVGLFIFAGALFFYKEWLEGKRKNVFLLGLSLSPIFSLLYIFLTWFLSDVNSVFMGIHAYLNIPAIGTSIFLAIIIYLIYQKLKAGVIAKVTITVCVLIFSLSSAKAVDVYFSYWIKNGLAATDQERMRNAFWKEIGRGKQFSLQNPALIYLDSFNDYDNGMYYENGFVWRIPAYLNVETGKTLPACDLMMYKVELNKLRIENRDGKKVVVQERCGYAMAYELENFYSFKLINRDIIPNKTEILQKLSE